jgi:hypothetical protein
MPTNTDHDYGGHTPPAGCDPDLIDALTCEAEGIAAQAAYNAGSQPELRKAAADHATARSAYRAARTAAMPEVQDLRHRVEQLVERIRCLIKNDETVRCLDRAYRRICRQLDKCGTTGGCCSAENCNVDKTCPDDYDELVSRIEEYKGRLQREKDCFTMLIAEPAALTVRVAAVKTEIDAITVDLGKDPATGGLEKLYVSGLVARRHLDEVWNGFDRTKDFLDCLCRALTCWTKTSDAVSVLTGCKAVKDCQEKARRKHCEDLATKTVEEVLFEYERLCGDDSCKDDDESSDDGDGHGGYDGDHGEHEHGEHGEHGEHDGDDDGENDSGDGDDGDCGCGHGHPHSRRHHDHPHRHGNGSR